MTPQTTDDRAGQGTAAAVDFTRARVCTPDVLAAIHDCFEYHPWSEKQNASGKAVREALENACAVIVANVPPGPDRHVAIRKLRECRMDCNSAITHDGRY